MDRDYSIHFPRVEYINELLFRVNKDEQDRISIEKFTKMVKAKELTMFRRNLKTYEDIMFATNER